MSQKDQKLNDEISIKELIEKTRLLRKYLIRKSLLLLIIGIIGGCAGFLYAWLSPVKYKSRLTFVVEESKSGFGGLSTLAGQLGFDVGGSGNGVFSGDNVSLFLKSESLCRETLLTNYDSAGNILLADKYAEINSLKTKWEKNKKINKKIVFAKYKNDDFPRLEDSLLQTMIKKILKKDVSIERPDRKAAFVEVTTTSRDELFSKYFNERLVKIATDRYVQSKTKIKALNVAKLQRRADSLAALLNNKTYAAAAIQQVLVDVNPAIRTAPVAAEITARDKTMIATIFAEVTKNLEVSKVALSQETPVVQIIDESYLPLTREEPNILLCVAISALTTILLTIFVLIILFLIKTN